MSVNPVGRIPALIADDGTVLYDSHVICEYLDSVHGGTRLFHAAGPRRWDALRRLALGDGALETLVLWRSELGRPQAQQSEKVLNAFHAKTVNVLAAIERDLAGPRHSEIDIGGRGGNRPEFDAWQWVPLADVPRLAVDFRRPVYEEVAQEFARFGRRRITSIAAE